MGNHQDENGNEYHGWYFDNLKEGLGRFVKNNGDIYFGMYEGGWRVGKGTFLFTNGDRYSGEWDGVKNGYGEMEYQDGNFYKGQFCNDKKNGRGKMIYKDGRVFDGNWANDEPIDDQIKVFRNAEKNENNMIYRRKRARGAANAEGGIDEDTSVEQMFENRK